MNFHTLKTFLLCSVISSPLLFAQDIQIGNLGKGVTAPENATGVGYIMYSAESIESRFPSHPQQSEHLMAVKWGGDHWVQYENEISHRFTPRNSDVLIAEVNYSADTGQLLEAPHSMIHGISAGFESSNLSLLVNRYDNAPNTGEFTITGTSFTPYQVGPDWWYSGQPPIIVTDAEINNKGPANIGQAKHMVKSALTALEELGFDALAIDIRDQVVGVGKPISSLEAPTPEERIQQKKPLRLGQLKAIAKPFYDEINEADATWILEQFTRNGLITEGVHYWQISNNDEYTDNGYYPWNPDTPAKENKAVATIGQLKIIFAISFDSLESLDSDNDGLPDSWEIEHFGNLLSDGRSDTDRDGLTEHQEFELNLDPLDSFDNPVDLDNDGYLDEAELLNGLNPQSRDNPRVKLNAYFF